MPLESVKFGVKNLICLVYAQLKILPLIDTDKLLYNFNEPTALNSVFLSETRL